jgi:integrase/recombinase XerD
LRKYACHSLREVVARRAPIHQGRFALSPQRRRRGRLLWIPSDEQWRQILEAARVEPLRNRFMLALAYDAALRREELCLLRTDDLDPTFRTLRVRAETTKNRRERIVPYSAATGELLRLYLCERRALSVARGPLFLSVSRRNRAAAITPWTWSKVVRGVAARAGILRFSTHTLRHLCLTDLARAGWELHAIAKFAGHYVGDRCQGAVDNWFRVPRSADVGYSSHVSLSV